jgi:hypothetical protein
MLENLTRIKSFNVCKLNTLNLREISCGTKTGLIPFFGIPCTWNGGSLNAAGNPKPIRMGFTKLRLI